MYYRSTPSMYPNKYYNVNERLSRQKGTFSMFWSFQGPFSALRHPPYSGQVQAPPRNSGNSLHKGHNSQSIKY